jgi:hypothetical protein
MSAEQSIALKEMPRGRAMEVRSRFGLGFGVLMTMIAVAGFWPQYYGALLRGGLQPRFQNWAIHY